MMIGMHINSAKEHIELQVDKFKSAPKWLNNMRTQNQFHRKLVGYLKTNRVIQNHINIVLLLKLHVAQM